MYFRYLIIIYPGVGRVPSFEQMLSAQVTYLIDYQITNLMKKVCIICLQI